MTGPSPASGPGRTHLGQEGGEIGRMVSPHGKGKARHLAVGAGWLSVWAGLLLVGATMASGTALGQPANGQRPELYLGYCQACHMPDAKGIPGLYPPLERVVDFVRVPEGRAYLARVVLFGMLGPITVGGETFKGYMPAFREVLDDATVADLLNELITFLRADGQQIEGFAPYEPAEIEVWRGRPATANEIHDEREAAVAELRRRGMPVP